MGRKRQVVTYVGGPLDKEVAVGVGKGELLYPPTRDGEGRRIHGNSLWLKRGDGCIYVRLGRVYVWVECDRDSRDIIGKIEVFRDTKHLIEASYGRAGVEQAEKDLLEKLLDLLM